MKKEILVVLLPLYADWEVAFVSATLNDQIQNIESNYCVKTVGLTKECIKSLGGLTVLPDYDIKNAPVDYAALLLIGGMSWCTKNRKTTEMAEKIIPLVQNAITNKITIGAICDATTFLGANAWLNDKKHTSNTLSDLIAVSGDNYNNKANYLEQQAVRDGNIITANGTAYLEFTKDVLLALDAYKKNDIDTHYNFYKYGFYEAIKNNYIPKGI